jgi:hypothetical protein
MSKNIIANKEDLYVDLAKRAELKEAGEGQNGSYLDFIIDTSLKFESRLVILNEFTVEAIVKLGYRLRDNEILFRLDALDSCLQKISLELSSNSEKWDHLKTYLLKNFVVNDTNQYSLLNVVCFYKHQVLNIIIELFKKHSPELSLSEYDVTTPKILDFFKQNGLIFTSEKKDDFEDVLIEIESDIYNEDTEGDKSLLDYLLSSDQYKGFHDTSYLFPTAIELMKLGITKYNPLTRKDTVNSLKGTLKKEFIFEAAIKEGYIEFIQLTPDSILNPGITENPGVESVLLHAIKITVDKVFKDDFANKEVKYKANSYEIVKHLALKILTQNSDSKSIIDLLETPMKYGYLDFIKSLEQNQDLLAEALKSDGFIQETLALINEHLKLEETKVMANGIFDMITSSISSDKLLDCVKATYSLNKAKMKPLKELVLQKFPNIINTEDPESLAYLKIFIQECLSKLECVVLSKFTTDEWSTIIAEKNKSDTHTDLGVVESLELEGADSAISFAESDA